MDTINTLSTCFIKLLVDNLHITLDLHNKGSNSDGVSLYSKHKVDVAAIVRIVTNRLCTLALDRSAVIVPGLYVTRSSLSCLSM